MSKSKAPGDGGKGGIAKGEGSRSFVGGGDRKDSKGMVKKDSRSDV